IPAESSDIVAGAAEGTDAVRVQWSDGSSSVISAYQVADTAARICAVANSMQSEVVVRLWAQGRSATWPACSHNGHTHPLQAVHRGHEAWWVCPSASSAEARIGALAQR
ncbi:MAG: hypothetical protein ABIP57_13975, partial [Jatrophihabitantaceae bacterium]